MIPEIDDFERRFGVRTATCYGQTEVGIPIATGWDHGPWANCGRKRMDYPWPDAVVVNEHDEPVAPGEVGELVVRSAEPWALNVGYYKMPEQTVEAWRNGWFHTGDAFRVDDDGWYYFVDRLRDAIRRRGENISSFEVETFVTEHDDVLECAAIGVPATHGEDDVMIAVIVARPERRSIPRRSSSTSSRGCPGSCSRATWKWSTTCRAPKRRCGCASTRSVPAASPTRRTTARGRRRTRAHADGSWARFGR